MQLTYYEVNILVTPHGNNLSMCFDQHGEIGQIKFSIPKNLAMKR